MLIRFIIYGLLGWNMEVIWTGFAEILHGSPNLIGHTSLWMFFIYGSASFLLEPIHTRIRRLHWLLRGCIWAGLIFAIEFISGTLLKLIGITAWNYTGTFAVLGVIRLDYFPAWAAAGLIFKKIHDMLVRYNIGVKR